MLMMMRLFQMFLIVALAPSSTLSRSCQLRTGIELHRMNQTTCEVVAGCLECDETYLHLQGFIRHIESFMKRMKLTPSQRNYAAPSERLRKDQSSSLRNAKYVFTRLLGAMIRNSEDHAAQDGLTKLKKYLSPGLDAIDPILSLANVSWYGSEVKWIWNFQNPEEYQLQKHYLSFLKVLACLAKQFHLILRKFCSICCDPETLHDCS